MFYQVIAGNRGVVLNQCLSQDNTVHNIMYCAKRFSSITAKILKNSIHKST